jgi:hypothetical protein
MMKQFIAALALVAIVAGPNAALAASVVISTVTNVSTSLMRGTGGGNAPIVKAKWEMVNSTGADDAVTAGAQLLPTGTHNASKNYQVCGIVTDPDGVSDIQAVYADVFYPTTTYLGPNHESARQGCGQVVQTECHMTPLTKTAGIDLFCNKIQTLNNNLPTFATNYNYNEICKADGELQKETAYVYCCDRALSYEDPSGDYRTLVLAQDKAGNDSNYLNNTFNYLPVTAFETDFTAVPYGSVRLNTEKIINGDLNFNAVKNADLATVRNIGNTRLSMTVMQDDMGLGQTGTAYNVGYKARVGNDQADWRTYVPNAQTTLEDELNLSETDEMDFGITITKFPPETSTSYNGTMTLGAIWASHLTCCTTTGCVNE